MPERQGRSWCCWVLECGWGVAIAAFCGGQRPHGSLGNGEGAMEQDEGPLNGMGLLGGKRRACVTVSAQSVLVR